jgi:adenylate cyclase
MDASNDVPISDASQEWARSFARHARRERRYRRLMRHVPSGPRCKLCYTPFRGFGRVIARLGRGPSRKNPTLCATCLEDGPEGGFETEAGVVFADIRGFTSLAESLEPKEIAVLTNRFYRATTKVFVDHEAIIDKLVGDEVMAVFWPPLMAGGDPREEMVAAGLDLLRAVGYGADGDAWLALGVGADFGSTFMGNVGGEYARDWTVLGDVVNVASRLQNAAEPGQLIVSGSVYEAVKGGRDGAARLELDLKGKRESVTAYALDLGADRRTGS